MRQLVITKIPTVSREEGPKVRSIPDDLKTRLALARTYLSHLEDDFERWPTLDEKTLWDIQADIFEASRILELASNRVLDHLLKY